MGKCNEETQRTKELKGGYALSGSRIGMVSPPKLEKRINRQRVIVGWCWNESVFEDRYSQLIV